MNRIVYGGLVGGLLALVTTAMGCGSSPCSQLAACSACDSTCQALVQQGNADACNQALAAYNQLNLCGGGTPTDMTITPPPDQVQPPPDQVQPPPDQVQPPPDVVIVDDEINPPPPDMTVVTVSPENVGSACTADAMLRDDANCGSAEEQVCIGSNPDDGTGPGFCSVLFCADDASCGAGNYCALPIDQAGTQFACVGGCTQAAGGCDTGLTCQPLLGIASICFYPICEADADCGQNGTPDPTLYCNTTLSTCLNAGGAGAAVGTACTDSATCPRNGTCLPDQVFPGGYCTIPECDAGGDFACPADATCVAIDPSIPPVCLKTCTADADCGRTGYVCMAGAPGGGSVCVPMQ